MDVDLLCFICLEKMKEVSQTTLVAHRLKYTGQKRETDRE